MSKTTLKARLILYHRGKILLLKQSKTNGGNYTLVGGTIESNETAKQSLIRESREEAGLELNEKDLTLAHVLHKRTPQAQRVTLYFKAQNWDGHIYLGEPEKFSQVEWFHLYNLPTNLTKTVAHVLKEYRQGNLYSEFWKGG